MSDELPPTDNELLLPLSAFILTKLTSAECGIVAKVIREAVRAAVERERAKLYEFAIDLDAGHTIYKAKDARAGLQAISQATTDVLKAQAKAEKGLEPDMLDLTPVGPGRTVNDWQAEKGLEPVDSHAFVLSRLDEVCSTIDGWSEGTAINFAVYCVEQYLAFHPPTSEWNDAIEAVRQAIQGADIGDRTWAQVDGIIRGLKR